MSEFTDENLVDLVEILDIVPIRQGDHIIKQGEEGTWVGMLLLGTLDVVVNGTKVASMHENTLIGELGYFEGGQALWNPFFYR